MPAIPSSRDRRAGIRLAAASILLVLGATAPVASQELVTDRPDFTESAVVVPVATLQVEGGATWLEAGSLEVLSGPELLLRWGLGARLELRLGLPDLVEVRPGPSGLGDASVGAKWQLGPTASGWDVALLGSVSLPVGDDELSSGSSDPELLVTLGRDLDRGWSLGTQVGVARVGEGAGREEIVTATLVAAVSLTDRAGAFFELAAEDGAGETAVLVHHGYTFQPRARLQLDVHAAVGLNDDAPDTLVGAGVVWRSGAP
jgi:hypothetical protein